MPDPFAAFECLVASDLHANDSNCSIACRAGMAMRGGAWEFRCYFGTEQEAMFNLAVT